LGSLRLTVSSIRIGPHEVTVGLVARAVRPLLLSGDRVMALGAMAGLQRRHGDVAVVWLDAHGDFNTPATTITGYLGGMPLAMLTGRDRELISDRLGSRPVADHQVVLVDARDLDPAERDALAASGVRQVPADPDAVAGALRPLGQAPIYLHVDLDIVDSSQLPGLRVPAGPGPALAQIRDCLTGIAATANIVGACLACTWLPCPRSRSASAPGDQPARVGPGRPAGLAADQCRSLRQRCRPVNT